ncbi:MAG: hypothetical protein BGO30_07420 [Bacteroidetes bacterium 41-46]|nr:MAG: hypothetical protein BGO30_07420 [Bacteroidetes bacterium 41-46]
MSRLKFIQNLSIKSKIILIVFIVVLTALALGFATVATWDHNKTKRTMESNLILNAKLIGDYCVVPLFFNDREQATEAISGLKFVESVEEAYLLDKEGKVFAVYPDTMKINSPVQIYPESGIDKIKGYYLVSESVVFKGERLGTILFKANTRELAIQSRKLTITLSLLALALLSISLILVMKLHKFISTPILDLANFTSAISRSQDFNVQLDMHGNDEVGFLYEQFNNMLAQMLRRKNERDIAEQEIKELNASLEKKVKERTEMLESANKELESFSYSVSHDLRAPLRHINGYLELLTKKYDLQLDEKGRHYRKTISEAATQMGRLIDDLLHFSRTGRMEVKPEPVDMSKIIAETISILESETKDREIEWQVGTMVSVTADLTMMRQVWLNLIGNAVKYTKKRKPAIIEIGCSIKGSEVTYFVRDNGAGFDMNYAQKLFGVFQRLHSNEEFEGTGIGLASVSKIVAKHNGKVWAEGEVDKGATFYFSLPILKKEV